jgi:hypothetical protein
MDEADGDRAITARCDPVGQPLQRGLVQRRQLLPLRADPARHGETVLARDQRRRQHRFRSYWSKRLSVRISITSRKPSVVMKATFAPRRSISALVASVVPWITISRSP